MTPAVTERTDDATKKKEQLVLKLLYLVYRTVINRDKDAKWLPEKTTVFKRQLACWCNKTGLNWIGANTLKAFELLLNTNISTFDAVTRSITLRNCIKEFETFCKDVLLMPDPEYSLPTQIEEILKDKNDLQTKKYRRQFYNQVKSLLYNWYLLASTNSDTEDEIKKKIMQRRVAFAIEQEIIFTDTVFYCNLEDIFKSTIGIITNNKGTADNRDHLIHAVISLKPYDREITLDKLYIELLKIIEKALKQKKSLEREPALTLKENISERSDDFDEIAKRIKVCQKLREEFSVSNTNFDLKNILNITLKLLGDDSIGSTRQETLLKMILTLKIIPTDKMDSYKNVTDWLEKNAQPEHMKRIHLLGNPSIFRNPDNASSKENIKIIRKLVSLKLLSKENLYTLLWHLQFYHSKHKHLSNKKKDIKHHSNEAPYLPLSLSIFSDNTITVKFKSKTASGKGCIGGSFKQFSHRLHLRITNDNAKLVLAGELRPEPKHRPTKPNLSLWRRSDLDKYKKYTKKLFKNAVAMKETINRYGLNDCIVPLGKKIKSIKRPGAIYYETPIIGTDLIELRSLKKIDITTLIEIIAQALAKLEKIHAAGLCGLDIKPDNMIWVDDSQLFFIDADSAVAPGSEWIGGTMYYLAPEYIPLLLSVSDNNAVAIKEMLANPSLTKYKTPLDTASLKAPNTDFSALDKESISGFVVSLFENNDNLAFNSRQIRSTQGIDVYALGKTIQVLTEVVVYTHIKRNPFDPDTEAMLTKLITGMCAIIPSKRFTLQQARNVFDRYDNKRQYESRRATTII